MNEKIIWKGKPSQWINFIFYTVGVLFCWLLIPIFVAVWRFFVVKTWEYKITNQRIIEEKGVFSRNVNELELYRVKSIIFDQPFYLRIFGLSNIILITSDKTYTNYTIPAIYNGYNIREQLRIAVEKIRLEKGIKEIDFR